MSGFEILAEIVSGEYGWILVLAYGFYSVHWGRIGDFLTRVDRKITVLVHAIRALGRTNSKFDDEAFEEKLPDADRVSADEFLHDVRADGGDPEDEDDDD